MKRLNQKELLEWFKKNIDRHAFLQISHPHLAHTPTERDKQAYQQIEELISCEDMVQQYRDEKEAEQAETELTYIEIVLDLYERIADLCKQLEAKK